MKRIYKVDIAVGTAAAGYKATHLVRAGTQSQAAAHVMKDSVAVSIPTQEELWALGNAGCKVEDA